jgi:hypothetical protein
VIIFLYIFLLLSFFTFYKVKKERILCFSSLFFLFLKNFLEKERKRTKNETGLEKFSLKKKKENFSLFAIYKLKKKIFYFYFFNRCSLFFEKISFFQRIKNKEAFYYLIIIIKPQEYK